MYIYNIYYWGIIPIACVLSPDASYCQGHYRPCDPRMLCTELPPPAQKSSDYFPIVHCTSCPKGTVGPDKVVYLVNGSVLEPAKCEGQFCSNLGLFLLFVVKIASSLFHQ